MAEGESPPTAAQLDPVIHERGAVAQQYWTSARVFQRSRLGFRIRLEVAVGRFTACSPGGAGGQGGSADGQQYQIVAVWEPAGVPLAEQAGLLQQTVPVIEGALNDAGWSPFRQSASSRLDVVATRQGITLMLDANPADPTSAEPDWRPAESYTLAGPCIPVTAQAATEFKSVGIDSYGTSPTTPSPIRILPGKLE
jgi:hypothetical protein